VNPKDKLRFKAVWDTKGFFGELKAEKELVVE
jgi:hypothetical protein